MSSICEHHESDCQAPGFSFEAEHKSRVLGSGLESGVAFEKCTCADCNLQAVRGVCKLRRRILGILRGDSKVPFFVEVPHSEAASRKRKKSAAVGVDFAHRMSKVDENSDEILRCGRVTSWELTYIASQYVRCAIRWSGHCTTFHVISSTRAQPEP